MVCLYSSTQTRINFLNTLADFMGLKFLPITPVCIEDIFDAIIDVFLANLSLHGENAVLLETRLTCGEDVQGTLVIFLNREIQSLLINRGKKILGIF